MGAEHYASDICRPLVTAADRVRRQEKVDWLALVNWGLLPALRADLDQLPHPGRKVLPPDTRLTLDQESYTITLDGTPYSGIDATAFTIFNAIWNARPLKVSSTRLRKIPALARKNIGRELDKLPKDLRDLVDGAPGSGYSIVLPPPRFR